MTRRERGGGGRGGEEKRKKNKEKKKSKNQRCKIEINQLKMTKMTANIAHTLISERICTRKCYNSMLYTTRSENEGNREINFVDKTTRNPRHH